MLLTLTAETGPRPFDGITRPSISWKQYHLMTCSFSNAPFEIGYLSIDTEGSELEILQAFNFKSHKIHVITVEHNYQNDICSGLYTLLTRNGFKRVFEDISAWDDWYVISES